MTLFYVSFSFLLQGAHMNPAVTLAFAVVRRLDWIKVPVYWLAQLLGAFIASAIVYGIYYGRFEMWASLLPHPPANNPPLPNLNYALFRCVPCQQPITIFPAHSQDA